MNITELARRLRTNPDELRERLPELGFDVGSKAIKVDDRLVGKIMSKWNEMKKLERLQAKYRKEEQIKQEAVEKVKEVSLPSAITVRDFAAKLSLPVNIVIQELMKNGILASLNEQIDFETASILAEDLGYNVESEDKEVEEAKMTAEEMKELLGDEDVADLEDRPPVVVVMGHVDHGKTALLDAIRKTEVVKGEAGGITQHIGAYQAHRKGRAVTFIDTPGHEAFTVMRSRGARVADIAILVVAVDDGVQPQTDEVIEIIKAAKLPFVVALNKIDKEGADLQKTKTQLSERDIITEEWGGRAVMAPISAKTGEGIDDLLEMILLVADMNQKRIRANSKRKAIGTVIESHVHKGEGPVATVLVQSGTLRVNDSYAVGGELYGRVRAMRNWNGETVKEATPGMPVRILGFKVAPAVGDIVQVPEDLKDLKKVKKQYAMERRGVVAQQQAEEEEEEGSKKLNVVLKADVLGSLEAIVGTLEKMRTPEVGVDVIGRGLGNVNESDVLQAEAAGGVVMGFNVQPTKEAAVLAREKGVEIVSHKVIYKLFDDAKGRLQAMFPAEIIRTDLGKAEILKVFSADKTGQIVGARVNEGRVNIGSQVVLYRGEQPMADGKILQIQSGRNDVKEVKQGQECGIKVSFKTTALAGDTLDIFIEEKKERKLLLPV
ncbi:MAG: translation initiation factor IF-2 [Patescibacteria group bacterium]|nr:translation initiation factor IF-2 [Patescibacteria group bacterium]